MLRRIWKDVRKREREVRLTAIPLVRDSTGGIAFELGLADSLSNLRLRLLDGTYRPHAPTIIEAAKSKLLHRRLSFLTFEDELILGGLVHAARPSLLKTMPEWVSFGRLDQGKNESSESERITLDYESWWIKWLRYRKLLDVIEGDTNPLLVVSDITNFFSSIDLRLLRNKVSGQTSLDTESNNLLFYLLENLRPAEGYSPTGSFGLPTVVDDTSRILANYYLGELDQQLATEGHEDRYTRWVDDMVISVPDTVEGSKVVARIERALSKLGLVANSSKTNIITKEAFRASHLEDENQFLDEIYEATNNEEPLNTEDYEHFEDRLAAFLGTSREGHWDRILRRYHTGSRRLRSRTLLASWKANLAEFPSASKYILDYASSFEGDMEFCVQLFEYIKEHGALFDDILILLYETLLLKPFPNDSDLKDYVFDQVYCHFHGKDDFERPAGYIKGLQALTMYKFGSTKASKHLVTTFADDAARSPVFATYGLPVLAASDDCRELALQKTEQMEDVGIRRVRALIQRLENGDDRATNVLLGLLQPKEMKLPTRWVINSRALPLVRIADRTAGTEAQNRLRQAQARFISKLSGIPDQSLVDWIALEHFGA